MVELINKLLCFYREQKKVIFLFLLAGALTAGVYFSFFALFWNILHLNHIISVSIAYSFAAAFHFFANKNITFQNKEDRYFKQSLKYLSLLIINYLITVATVQVCLLIIASPYFGLFIATGITAVTGYLLSKYWVFKIIN